MGGGGGGGWEDRRGAGRIPSGRRGAGGSGAPAFSQPGGRFLALTRSWAAGTLVYVAAGFLTSRILLELLGSGPRLETFGWRLALLHVPALAVTLLTVLAAARLLPDEYRESRTLYLLAALAVPLAGLAHGFAVSWDAVGIEGVLMPVVSLAAGAASGWPSTGCWRSAPPGRRPRRRTRTTGGTAAPPRRSTWAWWSSSWR